VNHSGPQVVAVDDHDGTTASAVEPDTVIRAVALPSAPATIVDDSPPPDTV
jgi:hypothetical protein